METDNKRDLNEKLLVGENDDREDGLGEKKEQGRCSCCTKLNNKTVLFIVCILFACFATSEVIAAVAANSLALLGDGSASCVDVITYFSNLYAETIATPTAPPAFVLEEDSGASNSDAKREVVARDPAKDERVRLIHEVYVPAFSVFTLVVVTIVILSLAAVEIDSGGDDDTNTKIMFAVATVNLGIDITCIVLFYYRKDDILHNRFTSFTGEPVQTVDPPGQRSMFANANINMFAAFTHIGSDTLRTLAIYLAAIVAATSHQKSSLCDAWAAVVVSLTIYIAMIPLCREVYAAYMGTR